MDKRVSAILLAAGRSQRMGRPKALLPIFGATFLEHIVRQIRASRLVDLKIVLGHQPQAILDHLPGLEPATVINSATGKDNSPPCKPASGLSIPKPATA